LTGTRSGVEPALEVTKRRGGWALPGPGIYRLAFRRLACYILAETLHEERSGR
jgi:hypothetical protein